MRDRKGNFVKNPILPSNIFNNNLSPRDYPNSSGPGIWSLRESDSDDSTGVANYDPFFNYVEFILKFEQQTGFSFPNSINRPYWFWHGESFNKSGKNAGFGTLTSERSRFGTKCYAIGSSSDITAGDESLLMFGQTSVAGPGPTRHNYLNIGYNDFTFEGWIYLTSLNQGTSAIFIIYGIPETNINAISGVRLSYNSNGDGALRLSATNNINTSVTSSTSVLVLNQWMHIAMARKNGVVRVFAEGQNVIESNNFNYLFSNSKIAMYGAPTAVALGTSFADETRLTNGIARYWNNFTPPSAEFYVPNVSGNNGLILPFDDNDQRNSINPFIKDVSNKSVWLATNGVIKSTLDGTFAVTIASPGVFTKTEHGLEAGNTVTFSTTGSLPTGLTAGTTYFVISTSLTASSFRVSATLNGAAINTSGTQSGAHSLTVTSLIEPVAKFANSLYSSSHGSFFYLSPDAAPDASDFNLSFWMRSMTANTNTRAPTETVAGIPWSFSPDSWAFSNGIDEGGTLFNLNRNMYLRLGGDSYSTKGGTYSPNKGSLRFYVNDVLVAQTDMNSILRDTWHHIHISRNQNNYRLFIGGTLSRSYESYRSTTLPSARWQAMAFGNSTFVAISGGDAASNIAASSADGITWTQRTLPASVFWSDVVYGDKFVAIAGGGSWFSGLSGTGYSSPTTTAATSTDGVSWTSRTMPASARWSAIAYGNGSYVAIAGGPVNSDVSAYSTDGIAWTQSTLPQSTSWTSIAYGNGVFVAASRGTIAATSPDGVTWTERTLPSGNGGGWSSLVYGSQFILTASGQGTGYAVASGYGGTNVYATSADGITWTARTLPFTSYWTKTLYGNGQYLMLSVFNDVDGITEPFPGNALSSTDGLNWSKVVMPANNSKIGTGVFGNNVFVGSHKVNTPKVRDSWTASYYGSNNDSSQGFISTPSPITKQFFMLGSYRATILDENTPNTDVAYLSLRFNGYLEDFVLTRSTGATTVTVPTASAQPPRVIY